ncbi:hypothetical protein HanIR_Chr03g0100211 [Helianthus annuus]|nr:hypothetical protein HanIR_Chr03g0100211 [Helianthus annuus]
MKIWPLQIDSQPQYAVSCGSNLASKLWVVEVSRGFVLIKKKMLLNYYQ